MNETSGNWVKNSYTINTGDNTSMLIKWTSERSGDAGEILLDAIQLNELKDPSFDGYITNGDFETGKADPWTLHQSTVISADAAHTGDYGAHIVGVGNWGGLLEQDVSNLVVGQKYLFSFWMKMNHQGVNVKIGENYLGWFTSVGDWTLVTKEFTATATTAKILINGGGDSTANPDIAADVYVDDFSIVELLEPSDDGYIYNGNFESGKKESFVLDQQTAITMAAAKDGNFGAELKGNGQWGGMLGYTFAVEAGATYQLSFDTKVIGKGANVTVLADTWQGAKLQTGWAGSADWSTVTLEFVATTNQCYLNINGSGTGSPEHLYVDNVRVVKIKDAHVCEFVGVETKAPTCGEDGVMTYSCTCGEGTYTEAIPATGEHVYFDDCSAICEVCGYEREVSHNIIHVEATEATCAANGNIEYWYCDVCGMAWLDAECTLNTNLMAVVLPATGEHVYFDDCSAICEVCGYEREVSHNVIHVEAQAATCTATGNIEYWYCDVCGMAWLDAECTMNTNLRAVVLPMAEHTYDDDYDADCNVCGAIRVAKVLPVTFGGNSVSEDVSGLAFKFDMTIEGMAIIEGTGTEANYTDATIDGYKLVRMGAKASNGKQELDIHATYLCNLTENSASFAVRIVDIPLNHLGTDITVTPYFVIEIEENVETIIYGEAQVASYNGALNG